MKISGSLSISGKVIILSSDSTNEITIEDVEVALTIIQKWHAINKRIEQVTDQIGPSRAGPSSPFGMGSMDDIVSAVVKEKRKQDSAHEEAGAITASLLSPEELKEAKDLTARFKKKKPDRGSGQTQKARA